jgi:PIN domain nuclease of toxin-antitoxin system
MKDSYVADTMAVVLRLEKRKMPMTAKDIFMKAEAGEMTLLIPVMALAEIGYLSEKKRIDTSLKTVLEYVQKWEKVSIDPMTPQVIVKAFEIDDVPELHDRIIAAAASIRDISLITNDPVIEESKFLTTVW